MKNTLPEFWSFNRARDASMIRKKDLIWQGPFFWTGYENHIESKTIPDIAGVYLFTFEYSDGYILRSVGVTNSIKRRLAEHKRKYRKGDYTLLDVESAQKGVRKELWHGWHYAKEHQDIFLENKDIILGFVEKELSAYRLFISEVVDARERERLEAAIVINTYSSKGSYGELIDGGMALRGRFNYEEPIEINNTCPHKLYGLPKTIEI